MDEYGNCGWTGGSIFMLILLILFLISTCLLGVAIYYCRKGTFIDCKNCAGKIACTGASGTISPTKDESTGGTGGTGFQSFYKAVENHVKGYTPRIPTYSTYKIPVIYM